MLLPVPAFAPTAPPLPLRTPLYTAAFALHLSYAAAACRQPVQRAGRILLTGPARSPPQQRDDPTSLDRAIRAQAVRRRRRWAPGGAAAEHRRAALPALMTDKDWMFCPTSGFLLHLDPKRQVAACAVSGYERSLEGEPPEGVLLPNMTLTVHH